MVYQSQSECASNANIEDDRIRSDNKISKILALLMVAANILMSSIRRKRNIASVKKTTIQRLLNSPNATALVATCMLAACSGTELQRGWAYRYGPSVNLPEDEVSVSISRQINIMEKLAIVAEANRNGPTDYYLVTLAGFNFVDEQCDAFLRELYAIEVERNRAKRGLDGAGLLTGAILQASPASKATMEIVAQAFGFAGLMADTYANSYLMNARPSTILGVVSKLQRAYQDQTAIDKEKITSRPAAYAQIRGYLQLCMPVTIESHINERVVSSSAVSGTKATGEVGSGPGTSKAVRLAD
ncbi:MAG: hypothetical protein IOC49_01725 [Methylobacterium sp.]|nr:hypothetical protein [Methylobacterium sp.]